MAKIKPLFIALHQGFGSFDYRKPKQNTQELDISLNMLVSIRKIAGRDNDSGFPRAALTILWGKESSSRQP